MPHRLFRPLPRRGRWLRRAIWLAAVLSVVPLTSSGPAAPAPVPARVLSSASPTPTPDQQTGPFVVLQMNLCNSGMAACYTDGRSIDEAAQKIRTYSPALVTLQEVCYDDLYSPQGWGRLGQAMADLYGTDHVSVDFVPALNRQTDSGFECLNGEQYGVAMMYHDTGRGRHFGWYSAQDGSEEERAWTCGTVISGRLTACTTHLSTRPDVAIRQCRELMAVLRSPWVLPEVIVGGDFNLRASPGRDDVRTCPPAGYEVTGDGVVQQVFFTSDIRWVQGGDESMRWTDHPLLFEVFGL